MRKLLSLLLLLPLTSLAQLDKIRPEMTEPEFEKVFPDVHRNFEEESGWVNDTTTLSKLPGDVRWKIFRDSVSDFYFQTKTVDGPSEEFPKADSMELHRMRESAEALRRKIELAHGKPTSFQSLSLLRSNPMNSSIVYLAEWEMPGGQNIRICITSPFTYERNINGSIADVKRLEKYYLYVTADAHSAFTRMQFDIGKTADEFLITHPSLKDKLGFADAHVYVLKDSSTCANAEWKFIFVKERLTYIDYGAYLGTEYRAKSDEEAYGISSKKVLQILGDAQKTFGKPDSLNKNVPDKYKPTPRNVSYSKDYVNSFWHKDHYVITLEFTERGGGKNPATVFNVRFEYMRMQ